MVATLPRVEIAYRLAGAGRRCRSWSCSAASPPVATYSASAKAWRAGGTRSRGPARRSIPTAFRVLGIDFLGGSHRTTGPAHGEVFPSVSAHDQAACLLAVMDHLGIERLHGCIGASYGGMVTLVLGATQPQRLRTASS